MPQDGAPAKLNKRTLHPTGIAPVPSRPRQPSSDQRQTDLSHGSVYYFKTLIKIHLHVHLEGTEEQRRCGLDKSQIWDTDTV
ncbi:hypothetical protein AV530_007972 [Patagioenas fasciata monilis]|uniref:Uncharacterized protein n=1 Tax=Patagioenas fasciata monilis TaxID=372326 RepID=A0A1V4KU14_PATFA|nr:hypothetical protein AV530_007972 [Patagioenas fasciata monilis]